VALQLPETFIVKNVREESKHPQPKKTKDQNHLTRRPNRVSLRRKHDDDAERDRNDLGGRSIVLAEEQY